MNAPVSADATQTDDISCVSGWEVTDTQAACEAACVISWLSVLGLFGATNVQVSIVCKL